MRPELEAVAARQHGLFLRSQANDCGYNDAEIRTHVRDRTWTRVRRGAYMATDVWAVLDEAGRHGVRTRAVMMRVDPPAVASHCSGAALTELPTWGTDLGRVHITRPTVHAGRIRAGVAHHEAWVDDADIIDADGVSCTSPRRTPLDVAREFGYQAGVVCADGALRRGVDRAEMESLAARMTSWPDSRTILPAVRFADGGAENRGESLARMLVAAIGLPTPKTQVVFRSGSFVARVDLFIEEFRWVLEFDGRAKYRRKRDDCDPSVDDADLVWAEKQREDELRELTRAVSRLVWADLFGARRQVAASRLWKTADRLGVPRNYRRTA